MTEERDMSGGNTDEARVVARYRSESTEAPSPALDARILGAARDAADAPPATRRVWRPLAVAAVVLLSATLVITMRPPQDARPSPDRVTLDFARPSPAGSADEPASAPARDATNEPMAQEVVVTGRRVASEAEPDAPKPSAKAAADGGELERRASAAGIEAAESVQTAEQALDAIMAAWAAGDRDEAGRLLDAFSIEHPDYPESELRDQLPAALLEGRKRP